MKKSLTLIAVVVLLVVVSAVVFTACMPSDPTKAEKKFKDADYSVHLADTNAENIAAAAVINLLVKIEGGVTASLTASNGKYSAEVVWFEKSSDAKTYEKFLKSKQSDDDTTYIKRDGKAVFVGDKEAYKFKKAD